MSAELRAVAGKGLRIVILGVVALACGLTSLVMVAPPEPSGVVGLVLCAIGLGAALDWFSVTTSVSSWLWETEVEHPWLARLLVPRGAAALRLIGLAVAIAGLALMRDAAVPSNQPGGVLGVGGHLVAAAAIVELIATLYAGSVVAREYRHTKDLDHKLQRAASGSARS